MVPHRGSVSCGTAHGAPRRDKSRDGSGSCALFAAFHPKCCWPPRWEGTCSRGTRVGMNVLGTSNEPEDAPGLTLVCARAPRWRGCLGRNHSLLSLSSANNLHFARVAFAGWAPASAFVVGCFPTPRAALCHPPAPASSTNPPASVVKKKRVSSSSVC